MSDEDSDATIIEPYEIQSIIAKYKSWSSEENPGGSTVERDLAEPDDEIKTTALSDSENEGPTPAKQLCETKKHGSMDEVDEILEELSAKYNLNFDVTIKDSTRKFGETRNTNNEFTQSDSRHDEISTSCHSKAGNDCRSDDYTKSKDNRINPDHMTRHKSEFTLSDSEDEMRDGVYRINRDSILRARALSTDLCVESEERYLEQHGDHLEKHEVNWKSPKDHLEDNVGSLGTNYLEQRTTKPADIKKIERARLQLEKQTERQKKKEEAERDKEIKKALASANKNLKPEECIKFITAIIDEEITKQSYGAQIEHCIRELGAAMRCEAQIMTNTVTWIRKTESHSMGTNGKLELTSSSEECEQVLLVLTWRECAGLVHAENLLNHIQQLKSLLGSKQISIVIYGMQEYFKYLKRQKRNEVHDEVTGSQRSKKQDKGFSDAPKVSRRDLEFALTELQMFASCCYRFIENPEDFGLLIAQFTKAIAQIPYKLEKQEKHQQADWYMSGSNKDCVRVDKSGNGLQRLWQQQLTVLPLARLETAEAILAKYPTLSSLMEAYDACTDEHEKKFLLQDIPIRRAAGPLTNARRLGPEFSRKIYTFFNMLQGNVLI